MGKVDPLYAAIGRKMREAREHTVPRLSQEKLAKRLGKSRASIVNIEAGRQHAPIDLLWKIAQILDTELITLIPRRSELLANDSKVELNDKMRKQIAIEAHGDATLEKSLTAVVGHFLINIEANENRKKS